MPDLKKDERPGEGFDVNPGKVGLKERIIKDFDNKSKKWPPKLTKKVVDNLDKGLPPDISKAVKDTAKKNEAAAKAKAAKTAKAAKEAAEAKRKAEAAARKEKDLTPNRGKIEAAIAKIRKKGEDYDKIINDIELEEIKVSAPIVKGFETGEMPSNMKDIESRLASLQKNKLNMKRAKVDYISTLTTEHLGVGNKGKLNWSVSGKNRKKDLHSARKFIEGMTSPAILNEGGKVKLSFNDGQIRAYCDQEVKELVLAINEKADVIIHEQMHIFDTQGTKVNKSTWEFLKRRAGTEDLSYIFNEEAGEVGYKDDFFDHYCGKYYQGTTITEILSMGGQKLYNDPVGFWDSDPEYFIFTLKMLRGDFE